VLGAAGYNAVDALAALGLEEAPRFQRVAQRMLGIDLLESYERKA
jgi:hypothetical protein